MKVYENISSIAKPFYTFCKMCVSIYIFVADLNRNEPSAVYADAVSTTQDMSKIKQMVIYFLGLTLTVIYYILLPLFLHLSKIYFTYNFA